MPAVAYTLYLARIVSWLAVDFFFMVKLARPKFWCILLSFPFPLHDLLFYVHKAFNVI